MKWIYKAGLTKNTNSLFKNRLLHFSQFPIMRKVFLINKPCLSQNKCFCKKRPNFKRRIRSISRIKPIPYPIDLNFNGWDISQLPLPVKHKKFYFTYKNPLSLNTKILLKNFSYKYIYYVIDDILYLTNQEEQQILLQVIFSIMLLLHNNNCVNFFDIWIGSVIVNEKLLKNKSTLITFHVMYRKRFPVKKPDPIW